MCPFHKSRKSSFSLLIPCSSRGVRVRGGDTFIYCSKIGTVSIALLLPDSKNRFLLFCCRFYINCSRDGGGIK